MQKFRGVIVWFVATLFVIYAFCLNTAAAVFSDAIKTTLHVSDMGVSLAAGTFILGFACMQIPAGFLLDKFNARFVVSAGVFMLALGNVMASFSDSLVVYTSANFLQGLGASFAFIAAAILISQWFSQKAFPILFGLTQALSCILAGVIHYCFTLALKIYSWNDIYRGLAVFGFVLFVLTLTLVTTPKGYRRGKSISLRESLRLVFKNKQILLCALAAATSFGILLAYASLWYMPIQTFYAVGGLQAVMISGIIFAGIGVGTPLLGWISNRCQSRVMIVHVSLVLGTMALLLGIYLPHFHVDTLIIIKMISFLIGFFLSGSMLFYTMVSEMASTRTRGVSISVLNTAVFLFNTFMLFIPYLFVTVISKEFFTYLWILPLFLLVSILINYFIKDTYQSE